MISSIDKYEDKQRQKAVDIVNQLCELYDIDPWELPASWARHECPRNE